MKIGKNTIQNSDKKTVCPSVSAVLDRDVLK